MERRNFIPTIDLIDSNYVNFALYIDLFAMHNGLNYSAQACTGYAACAVSTEAFNYNPGVTSMKKMLAFIAAAGVSLAAVAAPETYAIDSTHTAARFEYNHLGFSNQISRFDSTTGKIVLDRAAKSGSVDVVIDAKTVNTGYATFNGHIQGEDFFDTAKYPTITYKSSKLNFVGDKLASVDGDLTIKGVTKPVTLTVTSFQCAPHPMMKRDACGANAVAKIKRSEFNAGKYAPAVSDDVTLSFAVESIKE